MTESKLPSLRTLRDLFANQFDASPSLIIPAAGKTAGVSLTYAQLRATILRLSQRMFIGGLRAGDVVSLSLANNIEFVTSFIATTWLGAASAPLNPNYTAEEVVFYLQDTGSRALIVPRNGATVARQAAASVGVPVWDISYDKTTGDIILEPATSVPVSPSTVIPQDFAPDAEAIALILHTSGTTSRPKAVPLSHRNLCASIHNIALHYRLDASHRGLVVMPLFHVHGLMGALLSTFHSGGSVVIPPKFSASTFWPDFLANKCNWYSAVPTIHQILLQYESTPAAKSLPSSKGRGGIRFIRSCSSALAPATFQQLEDTFGVPVIEAYAMTEASHQMTSNELPPGKRKSGSVGRATINVGVQIMDDNGQVMPQGKEGEVCVRGANVTRGYINNPTANATAFHAGGWFRTGDQGILDTDGFVFLTGRLKELINRGGEKISPLELDSIMLEHPAVAEAIAFGVPDNMYGQEVHAAIVPKTPVNGDAAIALQADIKAFVAKKVAAFKAPKVIYFGDTLPRTATGKIQRRHVATHFIEKAKAVPRSKL